MDYSLSDLVFESSNAMFRKLCKKRLEGLEGWNEPTLTTKQDLLKLLEYNIKGEDWIDVAIIGAMLHYRKEHGIDK